MSIKRSRRSFPNETRQRSARIFNVFKGVFVAELSIKILLKRRSLKINWKSRSRQWRGKRGKAEKNYVPEPVRNVLIIPGVGRGWRNTRPASARIYQTAFLIGSTATPPPLERFSPPRSRSSLSSTKRTKVEWPVWLFHILCAVCSARLRPAPPPCRPGSPFLRCRLNVTPCAPHSGIPYRPLYRDIELADPYDVNGRMKRKKTYIGSSGEGGE